MQILGFYFSILLSAVCMLSPMLGIWALVEQFPYAVQILAFTIVLSIVTLKPLHQLRIYFRQKVEYDEFGRSKRKGIYAQLSRKERDIIDLQKTADMERILDSTMIKKITKRGSKNPERELEALIGLKPVKEKLEEMSARMEFDAKYRKRHENSMSGRHMVFFGNPGTGKTTVARILTGFLYKYGYIKKNKCIEIDGNMLKAGYDTATKTELLIREAYDGVLFIDEAYTLSQGAEGQEAIATLIKQMEDKRDRFILIMAGYTDEIQEMLSLNPGFKSRIKEYITFPDYTEDELCDILSLMAKEQGFTIEEEAYENFKARIIFERGKSSYGNARTVRNLLDDAIDRHALNFKRKKYGKENKFIIKESDFVPLPKIKIMED